MPLRLLAPAATATLFCLTITAAPIETSAQTSAQTSPQTSAKTSAGAPGTMSAERGWSSIARCAQEDTERARHACLDRVLREAGLLTREMDIQQQRRAFGLDERKARAVPPSPATTPTPSAEAATSSAGSATSTGIVEEALNRRAAERTETTERTERTERSESTERTAGGASPSPAANSPAAAGLPSAAPSSGNAANPTVAAVPPAQPDRLEVELAAVGKAVNGRIFVTTTDGAVWLQAESVEMPQPPVAGDRMTIRKGSMGGYRCSVVSTNLTYRCTRSR